MKRTIHGEALEERAGGNCVGMRPKRHFYYRAVWCPGCGAAPNRKCRSLPGDHHLTKGHRLKDGLGAGRSHMARYNRADLLTTLARESPAALYRLAVKPGAHRPPQHQVVDPSRLPLFRPASLE